LISQSDHAALAGTVAQAITADWLPCLKPDIVEAIALHDEGWNEYDRRPLCRDERPLSFIEVAPADFTHAWRRSIDRAEHVSALGGAVVSRHFARLAEHRLASVSDPRSDQLILRDFLSSEQARAIQLGFGRQDATMETLTDALQLCDLLSLYLCCGTSANAELPQQFSGRTIRLRCEAAGDSELRICHLEPSPFDTGLSAAIPARRWPGGEARMLPIMIDQPYWSRR
jgi:hypothetical protein